MRFFERSYTVKYVKADMINDMKRLSIAYKTSLSDSLINNMKTMTNFSTTSTMLIYAYMFILSLAMMMALYGTWMMVHRQVKIEN